LEESCDDDTSNSSSASGNTVDASTDVPVIGVSNTPVVSTSEIIVAVVSATSTAALSATKLSYQTLGDKALAKVPSWLPASLTQPADERKEEVYGPQLSSSNSADHVSCEEEEDVHHPKEDVVP
jgi:hypothetical protein